MEATEIYYDSKSAIAIAENLVQHGKFKHIQVKFHAIHKAIKKSEIKLVHCCSDLRVDDILTKALLRARFERLREMLGPWSVHKKFHGGVLMLLNFLMYTSIL